PPRRGGGAGGGNRATPSGRSVGQNPGPASQRDEPEVDTGDAEHVELRRGRCLLVDPDDRPCRQAEPGDDERAVRTAAAESPAARILLDDVATGRADGDDRREAPRAVL